jgi:hemerythrin-like domain-containing protein
MLRLEHENIAHVLDVLEDQLRRLESEAPVDEPLLLLIVEYLKDFPEECHHPKEDILYRMLQECGPEITASLHELDAEHQQLVQATEQFASELRDALDNPSSTAVGSLHQFVGAYRQHIATEEQYFFPAALASLTRAALADLDAHLFDRKDHLYDRAARGRFARLRRAIQKRAAGELTAPGSSPGTACTDEIALLRGLNSVGDFNESMEERDLQLVSYRAGGYALERDGHWLLDIPDCDERIAAWCAYFYAKGG